MRKLVALLFLGSLTVAGCDKKNDTVSMAPVQTAVSAEKQPEPPKTEPVADIEGNELAATMKCSSKANVSACKVLEEFDQASPWDLTTIQGKMARYFGQATMLKNGTTEQHWVFMIVKKMPINEVQPGDLAIRIAFRQLDPQLVAENKHATKLLYLLKKDDAVTKRNRTSEYILSYNSTSWDTASPTKGKSSILHIGDGAFVRQGNRRELYLISMQAAKPGTNSIDATVVKLFPLSW